MEAITENLLNNYQRNFPLLSNPYEVLAEQLGTSSKSVLTTLNHLKEQGAISRVGAIFKPNTVGASTLAAMEIEPEKLDEIANIVSSFTEVNHNYAREHSYNLWFVVTAENKAQLANALNRIEKKAGYALISLPLVQDYHIDLGFKMNLTNHQVQPDSREKLKTDIKPNLHGSQAEDLIAALQEGLPLVERPYQTIAESLGWTENLVIERLRNMIDKGIIKRLGVIVRHKELGYSANAMVVWNVPDNEVDEVGKKLGKQNCVTLCYQRVRNPPNWQYNLFTMVHGKNRDDVLACIEEMKQLNDVSHYKTDILFSTKRYKQKGAIYRVKKASAKVAA